VLVFATGHCLEPEWGAAPAKAGGGPARLHEVDEVELADDVHEPVEPEAMHLHHHGRAACERTGALAAHLQAHALLLPAPSAQQQPAKASAKVQGLAYQDMHAHRENKPSANACVRTVPQLAQRGAQHDALGAEACVVPQVLRRGDADFAQRQAWWPQGS